VSESALNSQCEPRHATPWPEAVHPKILFLLDARDGLEARLLREWVEHTAPAEDSRPESGFVMIGSIRGAAGTAGGLRDAPDDLWLQPLRIAWMPKPRKAGMGAIQNLFFSRIQHPGKLRRLWLARFAPERIRFIVGEGETLGGVRHQFGDAWGGKAGSRDGMAAFVERQALIVLEREERMIRGARYKVPRLLPSDVFADARFRRQLADIAHRHDRDTDDVRADAERYLREMGAMQTPFTIDLMVALMRAACSSNHDEEIDFRPEQLNTVAEIMNTRTVVFAITHKSMLDTMALSLVLFDANKPLPLTFGGINMNTPGLGALARRAGVIFLRRAFQDNEVYRSTFRRYVDYLIEKRFSLLWALEGTRSRTGKLLPPRFGLFNYVVDSVLRTQQHDVAFVPVTVVYDQITEVEDYAIEQRGHRKKPEGAGWILKFLKRNKSHGRIHLRFGNSLDIRELTTPAQLEAGLDQADKKILVQTLAFEVAVRMNAATPITVTAILALILLAGGNRALSLAEIQGLARAGMAVIRRRDLEVVGSSDFRDPEVVTAGLAQLHATGIVTYHDEGRERLYAIEENQHLNAAYYRNTAIHYFVLDALTEIALLQVADAEPGDREAALFESLERLRELFKFEFYLPRRHEFREKVESVLDERFSGWRETIGGDAAGIRELVSGARPLLAHGILRSFVDAYRVVARALDELGDQPLEDKAAFVAGCLKLGRQMRLQGRVFSEESVSKTLYETALKLAAHRELLAAGPDIARGRRALLEELRSVASQVDDILAFTLRYAGD
jgi:glycerol-3-phosphate O-acyltransferase